jgi:translation initiation factor IF-2
VEGHGSYLTLLASFLWMIPTFLAVFLSVYRCHQVIYQGPCTSLKRNKTDVDSVAAGLECGIVLGGGEFTSYLPNDVIECVRVLTKQQHQQQQQS